MAATTHASEAAVQTSRSILEEVLGVYHPRDFAVRFWDGSMWEPESGQPARFTLVLQHPSALRKMFLPLSDLSLGEAYIFNDFDIEGDIEAVFPVVDAISGQAWGKLGQARLGARLLSLPRHESLSAAKIAPNLRGARHSKARDQQAVMYHYDRSNEFYALWLDRRMVYSCAYFQTPDDDLDTAQEQKLEYICRKLRLQPGERLLDIGCGWGGLVIYAAQRYGVQAHGITLSPHQVEGAQERIRAAGLEDRCHVELRDYRDVNVPESYDKLVSVGMFEHVGEGLLPTYFKQAYRILKPGGVFLNHGIATNADLPPTNSKGFAFKYFFPDTSLVPIQVTLRAAAESKFEVRDVESLREHYALTLHHWLRNLEAHDDEARRQTDEMTYRIWRICLANAQWNFRSGTDTIYQTLLAKPERGNAGLPLTRTDWYQ